MNAAEVLQYITLAVSGWTLLEVINQGKTIAAMKQQIKDLPCSDCERK